MKCVTAEIAWHNREPVLSCDLHTDREHGITRLATAGADTHVIIWHLALTDQQDGGANKIVEAVCELSRHQKAVNVVRWSASGQYLASGDDEACIIIWKQKTEVDPPSLDQADEDQNKESWIVYKLLRGHLEDIYDISWCPSNNFLISGSVDNSAVIWDIHKAKTVVMLPDHKGFVQGVAWDPKNQIVVTMSSDRVLRTFDLKTKKVIARSSKAKLPLPESHPMCGQVSRLFFDDTLQSYFRRLNFSPDGELIAVPSGFIESDQGGIKPINAAYIYSRYSMKVPICILPCGDSPSLVVKWSPVKYSIKSNGPKPVFQLQEPKRMILAVATRHAVLFYDTQQTTPLAIVSNIHYTRLTDLAWSADGNILVVSSTDGYCTIIKFNQGELGELYCEKLSTETPMEIDFIPDKVDIADDHKENNANFTPKSKSLTSSAKKKLRRESLAEAKALESKSVMVIDEAAMEPWSENNVVKSTESVLKPQIVNTIEEATEDLKLVYEESQSDILDKKDKVDQKTNSSIAECVSSVISQKKDDLPNTLDSSKQVMSPLSLPKTPRRVNFITLSSPKSKKKLI